MLAPLQGALRFDRWSGGIAALNPRLLSAIPPGCCRASLAQGGLHMTNPWPKVRLGEVLRRSEKIVEPQADVEYREITVRL